MRHLPIVERLTPSISPSCLVVKHACCELGSFAVKLDDLPADLEPTHLNLNDETLEGMRHRHLPVFSVQYHPEAAAGPHDSSYLFEEFRTLMG